MAEGVRLPTLSVQAVDLVPDAVEQVVSDFRSESVCTAAPLFVTAGAEIDCREPFDLGGFFVDVGISTAKGKAGGLDLSELAGIGNRQAVGEHGFDVFHRLECLT